MVVSAMGVWLSLQNSAVLRLVHSTTYEILAEVNTAPAVTKMLSSKLTSFYHKQTYSNFLFLNQSLQIEFNLFQNLLNILKKR